MSCFERAYPDFLLPSPRNDQGWNSLLREPHAIQRCNQKEIRGAKPRTPPFFHPGTRSGLTQFVLKGE